MRELPVIHRSPHDEVRVEAADTGWYRITTSEDEYDLAPRIPTEALLAIVADRLEQEHIKSRGEAEDEATEALLVDAWHLQRRLATRSPDTKQEAGR